MHGMSPSITAGLGIKQSILGLDQWSVTLLPKQLEDCIDEDGPERMINVFVDACLVSR